MRWLTAIGLGLDIVGVIIIFLNTKRVETKPPLVDAHKYLDFQKRARWGLWFVVAGTLCQFIQAILSK